MKMPVFYDVDDLRKKLLVVIKRKGLSLTKIAVEIGINWGTAVKFLNGAPVSACSLHKIAHYVESCHED